MTIGTLTVSVALVLCDVECADGWDELFSLFVSHMNLYPTPSYRHSVSRNKVVRWFVMELPVIGAERQFSP